MADDIPEGLIAIIRLSRTIEHCVTQLYNHFIKLYNNLPTKSAYLEPSLQGSGAGGGVLARNASSSLDILEVELDCNATISTLSIEDSEFLTSTKPGYYLLRNHENFQQRVIYLSKYHPGYAKLAKTEYVNSKDVLAHFCSIVDPEGTNILREGLSQFMGGVHAKTFGSSDGAKVANTRSLRMNMPGTSKMKIFFSQDEVPVIKLMFWPVEALGWISECTWPSRDVREELREKHGCYLVPKQSKPGANDWRLTFPDIETDILNMLFKNKNGYLAYFLLKSLFYTFIHVIKCQCSVQKIHPLGSYIVKTILLNMSKYNPPESILWNDPKAALKEMLTQLISGLKRGNIPHFIIPELNILRSVVRDHDEDCRLLVRATKAVLFIRSDIDKHLGTLFAEHFDKYDLTTIDLSACNDLIENISTKLFKDFTKMGDFLSTGLNCFEKIKATCTKLEVENTENAALYQKFSTYTSQAITFSFLNQIEFCKPLLRFLKGDQAYDSTELLRCFKGDQADDFTDLWRDFSDGNFRKFFREWNDDQAGDFEEIDLD